jgi:hypothetical protein
MDFPAQLQFLEFQLTIPDSETDRTQTEIHSPFISSGS